MGLIDRSEQFLSMNELMLFSPYGAISRGSLRIQFQLESSCWVANFEWSL